MSDTQRQEEPLVTSSTTLFMLNPERVGMTAIPEMD